MLVDDYLHLQDDQNNIGYKMHRNYIENLPIPYNNRYYIISTIFVTLNATPYERISLGTLYNI